MNICSLTHGELHFRFCSLFGDKASVNSLIRQLHFGEFQGKVSTLQFVDGHWGSLNVGRILINQEFHTFSSHMDKPGVQVSSRPLQSQGNSISGRFQVTWQKYVITNHCYYWLRLSNHLRGTWRKLGIVFNSSFSSFVAVDIHLQSSSGLTFCMIKCCQTSNCVLSQVPMSKC